MLNSTKWVITFADLEDDEVVAEPGTVVTRTIHVFVATKADAIDFVSGVYDEFGPIEGLSAVEVPSTWDCDGRDNCTVAA